MACNPYTCDNCLELTIRLVQNEQGSFISRAIVVVIARSLTPNFRFFFFPVAQVPEQDVLSVQTTY